MVTFFHQFGEFCCIHPLHRHGKIKEILPVRRFLMRKCFTLLFLLLLVFPSSAEAQNAITLESLKVRLWSEYDQPSMLVIYDFELTPETTLPAKVDIRIPKDANITAVAYQEGIDLLTMEEFAGPVEDGNWQVITYFIKDQTTYHLEYYQPITRNETNRSFTYKWTGEYLIKNFRVEIQLPDDSTAVKAKPMLPFVPNEPFLSGSASVSNLEAGKTYQVELRYARTSEETVLPQSSLPVTASEPVTQDTAGRVTRDNLPYILGGIGVLLIGSAIYYFWSSNSLRASKPRKRQHNVRTATEQIYCHECGARAHTEDRFCRTCGSKLRTE